jgi:hypothetical protein
MKASLLQLPVQGHDFFEDPIKRAEEVTQRWKRDWKKPI